jgi:3-oxoacyl-[acyl-carrier-protein] synthase-3
MLIRWGDRVEPLAVSDAELPPCAQTGRELIQPAVEHFCGR